MRKSTVPFVFPKRKTAKKHPVSVEIRWFQSVFWTGDIHLRVAGIKWCLKVFDHRRLPSERRQRRKGKQGLHSGALQVRSGQGGVSKRLRRNDR